MPIYALAKVKIRYGKLAEFMAVMPRLIPIMEENGWKLLASYHTIVGDLHEAYDLWELPSADTVASGLGAAAVDQRYHDLLPDLIASAESETLTLIAKTPFSP